MATSKTTNTYNRQNWEDAVSMEKLKHFTSVSIFLNVMNFFLCLCYFFHTGISNTMSNMLRR